MIIEYQKKLSTINLALGNSEKSREFNDQKENISKMKNAKIIPYANPSYSIQLQDFSIFSDQIVGFTYGKKEIKE